MSNLDWGTFFRSVLGNRASSEAEDESTPVRNSQSLDHFEEDSGDETELRHLNAWLEDNREGAARLSDEDIGESWLNARQRVWDATTDDRDANADDRNISRREALISTMDALASARYRDVDEETGRHIYIANVPADCTAEVLARDLSRATGLESGDFEVSRIAGARGSTTSAYAFVKCPTRESAQTLIRMARLQEITVCGRRLRIEQRYLSSIRREQEGRPLFERFATRARNRWRDARPSGRVVELSSTPAENETSSDESEEMLPLDEEFDAMFPQSSFARRFLNTSSLSEASTSHSNMATAALERMDFFSQSDMDMFGRRSVTSVSAVATSRRCIYADKRLEAKKQLDSLEKELAKKLSSADIKLRQINLEKEMKENKRLQLQKQVDKLKIEMSKLESESAALDADRNLTEEALKLFVEEHEAKVSVVQDRIRKFRYEKALAVSSPTDDGNGDTLDDEVLKEDRRLPERVFDELDCICCFEKMSIPVYQCSHGHLICRDCYARLTSCPVCREHYAEKPIRSRLAEALVEMMTASNDNKAEENSSSASSSAMATTATASDSA